MFRHCATANNAFAWTHHVRTLILPVMLVAVFAGLAWPVSAAAIAQSAPHGDDDSAIFHHLMLGLLVGTMLTACCYLFFIWMVFRNLSQLLLIFMLLLLTGHMLFANPMVLQLFDIEASSIPALARNLAMVAFLLTCVAFTIDFLDLESNFPQLRHALFGFIAIQIVAMVVGAFMVQDFVYLLQTYIGPMTLGLLIMIGIAGINMGIPGSGTQVLAFGVFLAGLMAQPLRAMHIIRLPAPYDGLLFDNLLYLAAAGAGIIFVAVIANQFTTAQESKERMLQQSNERFSLAAQAANEGLYDWNLAGDRVYFSDRMKRLVGRNLRDNGRGIKSLWRRTDPAARVKLSRALRQFRRSSKNTLSMELRINRPDGNPIWLFATAVAVRSVHSGKIIRLVGSFGDITAKKRSESAMRLSEARFRSITEAHPVPVLIVKLHDGRIMYSSPGAEPMMGMQQADLIGATLHEFLEDGTAALLETIARTRQLDMQETTLRRVDGSSVPVAVSARMIDYQGEAAAVLGLYDLTERRQAEKQIAKQHEALQQSEKMAALGGLLAGVAHELNNPLSVIVGQSTLLKEGSRDPKTVSRSEKIFTAAERCTRIIKSFLAIARRKTPEHKLMQVNEAVAQALELLTYQLRTGGVHLHLELDSNLPKIVGDQDQFTQVISNLVLNAAQAMQEWSQSRQITIKTYRDNTSGQVCVAVCDTGPGIPKDIHARIFEPFFTTKAPGSGTGVGLSLCLNIVAAHGGQIDLQDTPGGGASFIITLPLPDKQHQPVAAAQVEPENISQNLRILLVDDEFELAQTLADLLAEHGHSFDFAVNGQIALDKLGGKEFDMILSDLRMPVMDGPTMYRSICEKMPRYKNRIVFLTGDTLTTFVHDFLKQNPVRFIEKPYTMQDINRAITEQLKEAQSAGIMQAASSA